GELARTALTITYEAGLEGPVGWASPTGTNRFRLVPHVQRRGTVGLRAGPEAGGAARRRGGSPVLQRPRGAPRGPATRLPAVPPTPRGRTATRRAVAIGRGGDAWSMRLSP